MIEEKNTVFNFVDITLERKYKVYRDLRELSVEEKDDFRNVMLSMGLYNGRFPYVTEVINSVVDEAYLALAKDMLSDKAFCDSMMDRIRQVCKDVCRAPHFFSGERYQNAEQKIAEWLPQVECCVDKSITEPEFDSNAKELASLLKYAQQAGFLHMPPMPYGVMELR